MEDLTTAYMLGRHDGRKAAQEAKLNHQTNDNMNNDLLTKTNSSHEISELKKENAELKRTLSDIMYTLSTIMDYQQPSK